jgi:hypothetical protein
MNKTFHFLAKKSVFQFSLALAVLANPIIYLFIGSVMGFIMSPDNAGLSFNTRDLFIQAMIFTSSVGFILGLASKISSWILAFRKLTSSPAK